MRRSMLCCAVLCCAQAGCLRPTCCSLGTGSPRCITEAAPLSSCWARLHAAPAATHTQPNMQQARCTTSQGRRRRRHHHYHYHHHHHHHHHTHFPPASHCPHLSCCQAGPPPSPPPGCPATCRCTPCPPRPPPAAAPPPGAPPGGRGRAAARRALSQPWRPRRPLCALRGRGRGRRDCQREW